MGERVVARKRNDVIFLFVVSFGILVRDGVLRYGWEGIC